MIDGLPNEPLEILRRERSEIAPFIGAGLSPVASTSTLVDAIRKGAESLGLICEADDLLSLSRLLAAELGDAQARQVVAAAVRSLPSRSTPTLEVLARCASRVIATFNYDDAIEQAIIATGRTPKPLLPNTAEVFRDPSEGEVLVVHLHGSAMEPETLILPGILTEVLNEDDVFKGALRHLWLRHRIVYLGFRLGPAETHLRAALGWLVNGIRDVNKQLMFVPRSEYESRGEELEVLSGNPYFLPLPYPDTLDHRAVHSVALMIAPRNEPTSDVVSRRAPSPVPYFLPPPIVVGAEIAEAEVPERTLQALASRLGRSRRILIDGQGGMGKTQLLRALGPSWDSSHEPLYAPLDRLAAILDEDEESVLVQFARFVSHAEGFRDGAPRPTLERLETGRFAFLLDGLDEVAARKRAAVAEVVVDVAAIWDQHAFLVASRPVGVEGIFTRQGFEIARLNPSADWGRTYLRYRGISEDRTREALEQLGEAGSELIAVPLQAAHVGESLVAEMDVPTSPTDFAIRISRDLVAREAGRRGWSAVRLAAGLERLAFASTFADVREISEEELAAICRLDVPAGRLRSVLVEAGLMTEVGDSGLTFPTRTQREGLAASMALRSGDLVGLLERVAVIEDGEVRSRPLLEQVLDWIWEGAPEDLNDRLLDLDPSRYLRASRSEVSGDLLDRALHRLWHSRAAHKRLLSVDEDQRSGSLEAVLREASGEHPEVISRHRGVWETFMDDPRPRVRANAIFLLSISGESGRATLGEQLRLEDDDRAVRLEALDAVARLRSDTARVRSNDAVALIWQTLLRFPADRYRYAQAMIEVAGYDQMNWVADAVLSVAPSPVSVEHLLSWLDLPSAIGRLERARFDHGTAEIVAAGILGSWHVSAWTAPFAERFFLAVNWPPALRTTDQELDETLPGVAFSGIRAERLGELKEKFPEQLRAARARVQKLDPGIPREAVEFTMGRTCLFRRSHLPNPVTRPDLLEELEAQQGSETLPRGLDEMATIAEEFGPLPSDDDHPPRVPGVGQ